MPRSHPLCALAYGEQEGPGPTGCLQGGPARCPLSEQSLRGPRFPTQVWLGHRPLPASSSPCSSPTDAFLEGQGILGGGLST